jgi:hypothetical protein
MSTVYMPMGMRLTAGWFPDPSGASNSGTLAKEGFKETSLGFHAGGASYTYKAASLCQMVAFTW